MPDPKPRLLLWGSPRVEWAGQTLAFGSERRWQLLLMLALHGGHPVERDRCATLLWPQHGAAEARRNLRKVLHDAQAALAGCGPADAGLLATEHTLAWPVHSDWADFDTHWQAGRLAEALQALPPLAPAEPLQGLSGGGNPVWADWLQSQRQRLQAAWAERVQSLLAPAVEPALRLQAALRLLHEDPLHETAVDTQIELALADGQHGRAQRLYDDYAMRLKAALDVAPSRALIERLAAATTSPPARSANAASLHPAARFFIGRRTERQEALALLAEPDLRLLTLLGPGGAGKSRLARMLFADAGALRFGTRCHWLDLQDLHDLNAVLGRLASQLGVEVPQPADAAARLALGLGTAPSLLVLDNAEHLADTLRPLIVALQVAAPALALLATSRVRLRAAGERLVPLQGLEVPDADSRDRESAPMFDAVKLFDHHARAARHDFRLERELPSVLRILDAVGGMPLAIELAAGWVRLLPTEAIAADLEQSLDLLQRDPAAEPAQTLERAEHRSMAQVLDRSWALLSSAEQRALQGLSVFEGGCTRAAAADVADCPLALASALADKSLLRADERGRFVLHPLVAAHARQQAQADPARLAALRGRHARHFAHMLEALAPLATGDVARLLLAVDLEYANIRQAWNESVARRDSAAIAAMTRALWAWFECRGRQAEGIDMMLPALAALGGLGDAADAADATRHAAEAQDPQGAAIADHALDGPTRLAHARLSHGLSMLLHRNGRNGEALALARRGLGPAEHAGDTEALVGCWLNTGMCLWADGHAQQAADCHRRGMAIARAAGHAQCLAWAQGNLGVTLQNLGEAAQARALLEQALAGTRAVGDRYNEIVQLVNLGTQDIDEGQPEAARLRYEAARATAARQGLRVLELYATSNLAGTCRDLGQADTARRLFGEAVDLARRSGTRIVEWASRLTLARMDMAEGRRAPALLSLQALAGEMQLAGSAGDLASCCAVYGDWLGDGGDLGAAAPIWRMAADCELLGPRRRQALRERLAALPAPLRALPATTAEAAAQALLSAALPDADRPGASAAAP